MEVFLQIQNRKGKAIEEKEITLRMRIEEGGKEMVRCDILKPDWEQETISLTWKGDNIYAKQQRPGEKERAVSLEPEDQFLGTNLKYADMRQSESIHYIYKWVGEDVIEASEDNKKAVYHRKLLHVTQKSNGFWVIDKIEYFSERKLLKTRENSELQGFKSGWRPGKIVVKEKDYTTILYLKWKEVAE